MKNKKVLALLVSLVLIVAVALPGTLAVSSDQDAVNSGFTVDTATPAPETATPAPETQELTGGQEQAVAPETPEPVLTCTCTSQPLTGTIHKEGCPLYVAPNALVVISHIETCLEGCTGEECTCVCHLFERIMACETMEEMEAIIAETPEEELKALTEEQLADIEARMEALMPAPLPAIVIEESEPPVESEVYRPTVNYACVAPFGAPVTGGQG